MGGLVGVVNPYMVAFLGAVPGVIVFLILAFVSVRT